MTVAVSSNLAFVFTTKLRACMLVLSEELSQWERSREHITYAQGILHQTTPQGNCRGAANCQTGTHSILFNIQEQCGDSSEDCRSQLFSPPGNPCFVLLSLGKR